MDVVHISEYQENVVLHFGGERKKINAYTLASSLVAIADAIKETNSIVNPGYDVEIVVETLGDGSFRAKIVTVYRGAKNLFSKDNLKSISLGIISAFIFQHTLAPDSEVNVHVDETQVVIEQGDKTIVIPRGVYDAQKEVEKSEKFRNSIAKTFEAVEKDKNVSSFGFTKNIDDEKPDIEVPRDKFSLLSSPLDIDEPTREIPERAELQIKRAILERSKRKWEFVWRGVKISAPVLDDAFYDDFFSHKITIAPGDYLEAQMKIYQSKDPDTGIYTNNKYEVIEVTRHVSRLKQSDLDI